MTFRPATALVALLALGSVATLSSTAHAQDGGDRGDRQQRRQGQGGPGGGRMDPEQMRERMAEMMKERLGATDEEWEVLMPRLEKVQEKQRDLRAGGMAAMMGGRGGFGGRGGEGDDREAGPVATASRELAETLRDENAAESDIAEKLKAVREAREGAEKELASAREELVEILTPRQEATLVMMGMLE